MNNINFIDELNQVQKQAVQEINGASLIIAGAGSGKTRVLTYKIAYLLNQSVAPQNILSLTFTNKAAKEMRERIDKLLQTNISQKLWMGTFHSVFSRILRIEAELIGYTSNFTIYDTQDSKSLLKRIIKEMELDENKYKANNVYNIISKAKNNLISTSKFEELQNNDRYNKLTDIYRNYVSRCKQNDAMDFDDLLYNTNILFREFPDVLDKYQDKFRYILVDEYQDTNFAQYLITRKLAEKYQNICVVGDDSQSIYAFRGADISNILNFKNDYKNYKLFKLEQNYRSTQNIVNAANSLISKNQGRIPKTIFSKNEEGNLINLSDVEDDREEGFVIARNITNLVNKNGINYSDIAILYRTNSQSRQFEEIFRKMKVPYIIRGGTSFYERKEIKDVIAYFRLIINKSDDEALKRIINFPARKIGDSTMEKLEILAKNNNCNIWKILINIDNYNFDFNSSTTNRIKEFVILINNFTESVNELSAYDLAIEVLTKSGIISEYKKENTDESTTRLENIEELVNAIKEFSDNEGVETNTLDTFIHNVSLLTNEDKENKGDNNKVSLMTVHSAKGLEFEAVFIAGAEDNLFPSEFSKQEENGIEEERRLFYVAMTRAKTFLNISYCGCRSKWGEKIFAQKSRFLNEIDNEYFEIAENNIPTIRSQKESDYNDKIKNKPQFIKSNLVKTSSIKDEDKNIKNDLNLKIGSVVNHNRFGYGTVIDLEGEIPNTLAKINFRIGGEKRILVKFAKIEIL